MEFSTLYILFPENKYYRALQSEIDTDENGYKIPVSLTRKQFNNWLANNKVACEDLIEIKVELEIVNN